MARRPRLFAAGLLYHVIVRGNQRQKTFASNQDFKAYLDRLDRYRAKFKVRIYAYCLMPNHAHLLLETGSIPLSKFMQGLQQSYTQYYNRTHRKVGHLFQGRYQAIICDKDRYLLALVRYIHLNPVRAGLVKGPERYPYSGHASYLISGTAKILETGPVLKLLGGKKNYEKFVLDGTGESHNEEYYEVEDQRFLGAEGFGEELSREAGEQHERRGRKSIETAMKEIALRWEISPAMLRGKDRRWEVTKKRAEAVTVLVRENGFSVTEVAAYLRRDPANVSMMLSRLSAKEGEPN
ncbi:MAG: transposase [Candidatus Binatia bacterium]